MSAHSTAAITQISQWRRRPGQRNHVGESERSIKATPAAINTTSAEMMITSIPQMYRLPARRAGVRARREARFRSAVATLMFAHLCRHPEDAVERDD